MAQSNVRTVPTFRAPTAYEEEMMRAKRQQQLAEMLRQQAFTPDEEPYTFQGFRATPSPANAIARVLSAYTSKKLGEKAEQSEAKARQADLEAFEALRRDLGPQTRSVTGGALPETDVTGIASAYQPEMAQQPMMETVMPTAQERRDLLMQTMVRGTPMARQLAQFLAAQEPKTTTTEFGGQLLNVTGDTATPVTMGGKPLSSPEKPKSIDKTVDLGNVVEIYYTDGTVEKRPKGVAPTAGGGKPPESAEGLRKEFTGQTAQYRGVADAFVKIKNAAMNPSAANDLALIFSYMRALDPASTVREGEFATAQNAAGVDVQIRNLYNKIVSGERLSQPQRQDFLQSAYGMVESQIPNVQQVIDRYTGIASRSGLNPEDIVSNPLQALKIPRLQGNNDSQYKLLKSGDLYFSPDGVMRRKK
jgi:hypothetical protein